MNEYPTAVHYPDRAWHGTVVLQENVRVARDTYRIRFHCPWIARTIVPGQFMMVRLADTEDPLLGRPLALWDVVPDAAGQIACVEVVYRTVGRMTGRLAELGPGARLEVWGPLGNGFPASMAPHVLMVAGGIGHTPMLALAQECLGKKAYGTPPRQVAQAAKATLCYGEPSQDYLAGLADFERVGVDVHVSTEDGSAGHRGLVTELIAPLIGQSPWPCQIVCCGPEPMMRATAQLARQLNVPCLVSLETPMACGIGICFSCVARVRDGSGHWDYRRTCVEGPVFNAQDVEF